MVQFEIDIDELYFFPLHHSFALPSLPKRICLLHKLGFNPAVSQGIKAMANFEFNKGYPMRFWSE